MPEPNPMAVIVDCIEKSKATTDPELISDYIAEALGVLQIDYTEEDAFNMLGSAIADAVAEDEAHTAALSEVWSELEEQRKLQYAIITGLAGRHSSYRVLKTEGVVMDLPQTGACQCGAIRYEIGEAPQLVYTCHCRDCQRLTSSAFSIGVVVA